MKLNILFKLTTAVTLLIYFQNSWAGCTSSTNTSSKTFSPTTISISRDKSVNSVVANASNISGISTTVTCTSGTALYTMLRYGTSMTAVTGMSGVYKTNIDGIGVKVWDNWSAGTNITLSNNLQRWYYQGTSWNGGNTIVSMQMQLIVTGPVSTGTITFPVPFVEAWMGTSTATTSGAANYNVINMQNVIVKVAACKTPDITVNLGKHQRSEFTGLNTTTTATPFVFAINDCDPGLSSVNYTFKPASGIAVGGSGSTQHIALDSSSSASGVGIQVLYDSGAGTTLVPLNSKTKFTGYSTTLGGSYTIPMKARYIQTAANISGGTANSAIEFTMSYE